MKLANKITLLRFALAAIGLIFIYLPGYEGKIIALAVFILAITSDHIDGWIAKKYNQRTFFGKLFDQTADKVLVNLYWLAFLDLRLLPFWLVALNLAREIIIVSIRGIIGERGIILESKKTGKAEFAGRLKAALQMLVILAGLVFIILSYQANTPISSSMSIWMLETVFLLGIVAVSVSYWAFIDFIWKYRKILLQDA